MFSCHRGKLSTEQQTDAILSRHLVAHLAPSNAEPISVTVARESALAAARRATHMLGRKATTLPLLHGVPVSIKDLFATKRIRTTWGSLIYKDHVPDGDDLVVQRLKTAGAIVVGKTNTPEFGAGGNTFNAVFGIRYSLVFDMSDKA